MNESILIGTRGWCCAPGSGFYPAELPDDWRFSYYCNNLRSVLVPQETWDHAQRADVAQWQEDSDPAFRFVIELPATLSPLETLSRREQALEKFLETLEPISSRIAGLLLRIPPDAAGLSGEHETFLNQLATIAPLCVDLPDERSRTPAVQAMLERQGASLVWHCSPDSAPQPGGRLMVALAPPAPARELRQYIERLSQWQGQDGMAGLFFDADATRAAQEARLIAELMGV